MLQLLLLLLCFAALAMIALGTGLFKGNLQVMVGNLYDDPKYADREILLSLFSIWQSISVHCLLQVLQKQL